MTVNYKVHACILHALIAHGAVVPIGHHVGVVVVLARIFFASLYTLQMGWWKMAGHLSKHADETLYLVVAGKPMIVVAGKLGLVCPLSLC
jgi:hypothetical protein